MSAELTETEVRRSKGFISLQDCHLSSRIMDVTRKNSSDPFGKMKLGARFGVEGGKRRENRQRAYSQGHSVRRRMFWASYFSLESVLFLICLTASLLILPLVLPPLPPPPFMLLLIPLAILALLMVLAFMPSNVRDLTSTYM